MAQLRRDYHRFAARGAEILVIGNSKPGTFAEYWQKADLPFPGLPDVDKSVLKRYGMEFKLFKLGWMPALVLVDEDGMVRFAYYGNSMKDIPPNSELLTLLEEINQQ